MSQRSKPFLLESGRLEDIPKSRAKLDALLKFHWEYHSELAFQRSKVYDSLKGSLLRTTEAFRFSSWQRAVKYKYSLDPLNTKGSRVDPGGRFNIGTIDTTRFVVFPGLYLAADKSTALAELLGRSDSNQPLTPEELALTKPDSVTVVSVSGNLESVFDVRDAKNLVGFVNLIKDFQLSSALKAKAKELGLPSFKLTLIGAPETLQEELMKKNWRLWPMQFDVPTSSQIFGQIVQDAGIEGILYNSTMTEQPCLVVYPQNFANSPSFVELDGPLPSETVPRRLDRDTFKRFI
jgi:hypothetical protein